MASMRVSRPPAATVNQRDQWQTCVRRLHAALESAGSVAEVQVAVRAEHAARCRYASAVRASGKRVPWYLWPDALVAAPQRPGVQQW